MKTKPATRARTALTHRFLEALNPEPNAYRIPDARCAGLAVRVAPSGVVTFDLAFRIAKSKVFRRLSLGKFPDVSLEEARNRAGELTRAARAGRDLLAYEAAQATAESARPEVGHLVDEYAKRRLHGRLRTSREIESRLKRALKPVMKRKADDLRRADLRQLLDACADAGYPREAEQRRIGLNGLFRWALAQDYIGANPMTGLTSYGRSPTRKRVLDVPEIEAVWRWLGNEAMPPDPADVLRLQLCLGARCTEVGGMRVEEFDLKTWQWTLPAERSKNKQLRVTPIVGLAREILTRRLAITRSGCLFLTSGGQRFTSANMGHFLKNRRSRRLPIEKFTTHDLRRTVATEMAQALSIPLDTIARVIGHMAGEASTRTLVAHYVSAHFIEEKKRALLAWDSRLRAIVSGSVPASNVVSLADLREAGARP